MPLRGSSGVGWITAFVTMVRFRFQGDFVHEMETASSLMETATGAKNSTFLAGGQKNVASPIGKISPTPENVQSPEGRHAICGKMDTPTLLHVPLEARVVYFFTSSFRSRISTDPRLGFRRREIPDFALHRRDFILLFYRASAFEIALRDFSCKGIFGLLFAS